MIRRWYLYAVSGITLQAVTWAVIGLLRGLLAGAGAALPQSTSLQLSVVLIGLPIFGLHWRWVQHEVGAAELALRNEARPVYVHVNLLSFVVPWLFSASWLIEAGLQQLPNTTSASQQPAQQSDHRPSNSLQRNSADCVQIPASNHGRRMLAVTGACPLQAAD